MKKFFFVVMVFVCATAHAAEPACKDSHGREIYDVDFCKVVEASHEALEMNRKLLDRSEAMRKLIDKLMRDNIDGRARKARP